MRFCCAIKLLCFIAPSKQQLQEKMFVINVLDSFDSVNKVKFKSLERNLLFLYTVKIDFLNSRDFKAETSSSEQFLSYPFMHSQSPSRSYDIHCYNLILMPLYH